MLFNPLRGFRYGSEKPWVIQHFILFGPADDTRDTFCEQNPLVKFVCLEHGDINYASAGPRRLRAAGAVGSTLRSGE